MIVFGFGQTSLWTMSDFRAVPIAGGPPESFHVCVGSGIVDRGGRKGLWYSPIGEKWLCIPPVTVRM